MCGFMYCADTNISAEDFQKAFEKIAYRGPDQSKVLKTSGGFFGFHRLSIMDISDSGMQPFQNDGDFCVCNGELYDFQNLKKELKQTYHFYSDSDCELLLPLYYEYGVAMFQHLDAEFACVIYDHHKDSIIAARDPFGIRPMFYGYHKTSKKIMFASEAKCLIYLCDDVFSFPPGHYYHDEIFTCYYDVSQVSNPVNESIDVICENINSLLVQAVKKRLHADTPIGFLLSGGLDSSIICSIASQLINQPIHTFAIGMEKDAIDLKYAKQVAENIGSIHTEVIISKDDVITSIPKVIEILETWDITTIRASIGMYLLCQYISEKTDIKVLFSGEIADELFGYKYTDFAPNACEFQKEAQKRVKELYMYDGLRADRCISSNGLEARVPFGDLAFSNYVMSIVPRKKMNTYGIGKHLLRQAFKDSNLPNSILHRDKAAFSDAVGHSLVDDIKQYVESLYTDEQLLTLCKKYTHCAPHTKESLYYREVFNEKYKGFDTLISAYWLPNQTWDECKVSDPSARYLSNYGKSGI